ncbi:MAG: helix-turn-helix domain-containing protein [Negativicutes bacterium]|nr:helix-turn-helix domain-containing protein [Negativicutes bacterium]
MNNEVNQLITVEELCEVLMVGKNTAYKLLSTGELKAFRINRVWKIPRQAVTDYILSKANYPVT